MKLTTPKAVLIGSALIALAILFKADFSFAPEAKAEVAGMAYYELQRDRDFRRAVQSIADDCSVTGSVTGSVDGDYFDGTISYGTISC